VKGCSSGKGDVDAFMPGADLGCGDCFTGLSASVFKGLRSEQDGAKIAKDFYRK